MRFLLILFCLFITNCTTNKVVKNHGTLSLEKKYNKIIASKSNRNDIIEILGPPSTESSFDDNIWIYIERKKTNQSFIKLGEKKIQKNNVVVVEFNEIGILKNKELYNLDDINNITFDKEITVKTHSKNSYIYSVLTSLREKISAPAKRRNKKN